MKKAILLAISVFAIMLIISGCGATNDSQKESRETLTIYTSLYPIEDFTEKIGGDFVQVTNIVPAGADAHTFEPSQRVIVEAAEADLFIYNGVGLEPFVENMREAIEQEHVTFIEAGKGIETTESEHGKEEDDHEHDEDGNPHIWLDPMKSIQMAETIKNALVELKPEAKEQFEENFTNLKKDLEALDQDFSNMAANAPKKTFLVSHAAYSYWEERYGLEQVSITGLSTTNEPSQKQLQELIDFSKENEIRYLLLEQNVRPKIAEMIQNAINADVLYLHNIAVLTEEDIDNEEDYFSLMRKNIETLEKALQK